MQPHESCSRVGTSYISRCMYQMHLATSTQTQSAAQFGTCTCGLGSDELVRIPCVFCWNPTDCTGSRALGCVSDMFVSLVIHADPTGCRTRVRLLVSMIANLHPLAVVRWQQQANQYLPKELNPARRSRFCPLVVLHLRKAVAGKIIQHQPLPPITVCTYRLAKSYINNCACPFPGLRRIFFPAENVDMRLFPSNWTWSRGGLKAPTSGRGAAGATQIY